MKAAFQLSQEGLPAKAKPSAAGGVVDAELALLNPANGKKIYDMAGGLVTRRIHLAYAAGELSAAEYETLLNMKPGGAAIYLKNKGAQGGTRDCISPEDCSSACTGINAQMQARRACLDQFIDELIPEDGRPVAPLETVINWGPDSGRGMAELPGAISCLLDATGGGRARGNLQCTLVDCANGPATTQSGAQCCAGAGNHDALPLEGNVCLYAQCPDGVASVSADGSCLCGASGGIDTPPPMPGPERGLLGDGPEPTRGS